MALSVICEASARVKDTVAGRCVLPRYCNTWNCVTCQPYRLKLLMAELAGGNPTIFVTITWAVDQGVERLAAAKAQRRAWAKYVAWYNRRHGEGALQYMVVCEGTRPDWPHLHILCRAKWIPHTELSAFMEAEIGSPIVEVQSLKQVRSVARYLAKYMSKGPRQYGTLKRYWRSLKYLMPDFLAERAVRRRPGGWRILADTWQWIAWDAVLRGFSVERLSPGAFIRARAPP